MDSLISTEALAAQLGNPDIMIADATWFLPNEGRDAAAEFAASHIPGAIFLDLEHVADPDNPLPMTLPTQGQFERQMAERGISDQAQIFLYDNSSFGSAARAWWMLSRVYGAERVAVLDGGFAKWLAEGRPVASGAVTVAPAAFAAKSDRSVVKSKSDMLTVLESRSAQILDARGPGRFSGDDPEPRAGMASGHIPGSLNLPYARLYHADGTWKRSEALRAAFVEAGVDLDAPIITTCGSGMSAGVLAFGAHLLGKRDVALYDGSWSEWGADPETPKATGPA
jgi:thiosulfate/3-mercaptopyruvate sulfurtransferase